MKDSWLFGMLDPTPQSFVVLLPSWKIPSLAIRIPGWPSEWSGELTVRFSCGLWLLSPSLVSCPVVIPHPVLLMIRHDPRPFSWWKLFTGYELFSLACRIFVKLLIELRFWFLDMVFFYYQHLKVNTKLNERKLESEDKKYKVPWSLGKNMCGYEQKNSKVTLQPSIISEF